MLKCVENLQQLQFGSWINYITTLDVIGNDWFTKSVVIGYYRKYGRCRVLADVVHIFCVGLRLVVCTQSN